MSANDSSAPGGFSLPDPGSAEAEAMAPLCSVFRRYLKSLGLKYTPERADILNAIIERDDIFEVDELLGELRERGHRVSKATVYRTIKLLEEGGIITKALFDDRQAHFQLVYGKTPQSYLVCVRSGKILTFVAPELRQLSERIAREHGWTPVGHRFQIYATSPGTDRPEASD